MAAAQQQNQWLSEAVGLGPSRSVGVEVIGYPEFGSRYGDLDIYGSVSGDSFEMARGAAFTASGRASDSGAVAFGEHREYGRALRDNRAAFRAWDKVRKLATAKADQDDAQDRCEELDVALSKLKAEMVGQMHFAWTGQKRMGVEDVKFDRAVIHGKRHPALTLAAAVTGGFLGGPIGIAGGAAAAKLLGWW